MNASFSIKRAKLWRFVNETLLFEGLFQQTFTQLNVMVELLPNFLDRLDLVLKVSQLQPRVGRFDVLQKETKDEISSKFVQSGNGCRVFTLSSS